MENNQTEEKLVEVKVVREIKDGKEDLKVLSLIECETYDQFVKCIAKLIVCAACKKIITERDDVLNDIENAVEEILDGIKKRKENDERNNDK